MSSSARFVFWWSWLLVLPYVRLLHGVLGAVMIGWGVALLMLVRSGQIGNGYTEVSGEHDAWKGAQGRCSQAETVYGAASAST